MTTLEERRAKANKRLKEKIDRERRFPNAQFGILGKVWIKLRAGDDYWMEVSAAGEWPDDPQFPGLWKVQSIALDDPDELVRLIVALIARYNHQIDGLNKSVGMCKLKKAKKIASGKAPGNDVKL